MSKKHDIIKILEFAESKTDGFTLNESLEEKEIGDLHLRELGNSLFSSFVLFRNYPNFMFTGYFSLVNTREILGRYKSTPEDFSYYEEEVEDFCERAKFVLSTEGYFKLLEFQALEQAKNSSKWAHWTAIIAILIGIAVGAWQIFLTYFPPCK